MKNCIESGKIDNVSWAVGYDQDSGFNPQKDGDDAEILIFPTWSERTILGFIDGAKEYGEKEDFLKIAKKERWEVLPVYCYEHSDIALSTTPFSCRWDSGHVGFIAVSPEIGRKEWGTRWRANARKYMKGVVAAQSRWLNGEAFCFEVTDESGNTVDSCGGFESVESATAEAISSAKWHVPVASIDVNVLTWWDRVNGNPYFAGTVTTNYGTDSSIEIFMQFQYGNEDLARQTAAKLLNIDGVGIERYGRENGIIFRFNARTAKLRELKALTP